MTNLKPDVLFGKRPRRVIHDVFETLYPTRQQAVENFYRLVTHLQTLVVLLLLLVDDSQAEIDFIGLLKVWSHAHNLGESFLRMVQRTVAVIKDTNAIP